MSEMRNLYLTLKKLLTKDLLNLIKGELRII